MSSSIAQSLSIEEEFGIFPSPWGYMMTRTSLCSVLLEDQFGLRRKHATTEQVKRIFRTVWTAMEEKKHYPGVFPDVKQAFTRIWLKGLIHKTSNYPTEKSVLLL
mgnify:CR=1 FL=1